jgi:hypothetical protein
MKKFNLLVVLLISILFSCDDDTYSFRYFPDKPENMAEFNSEYDDYNSYLIVIGDSGPFCFSSNRNSLGKNFNIIYKALSVYMEKSSRRVTLIVSDYYEGYREANEIPGDLTDAVMMINTQSNELGPFLIPQGEAITEYYNVLPDYNHYIFLYATDESGNLDIQFTENITKDYYCTPEKIKFCNSSSDDAYPTIMPDTSSIYFCSDREGSFDIYSVDLSGTGKFINLLYDQSEREVKKVPLLSSEYNDKCPFIAGNLLVFTSDRPDGYGGFDLYYSIYDGSKWSSPVNFGGKINSAYDEYRPFVKIFGSDFENDFMIFSSNRPGGKGGYDLYYVGIRKMTE